MVDPSAFAPFNLAQSINAGQQVSMNRMRMDDYREGREDKRRLRDLLPSAAHGNQDSIDQIAGIDPNMFMKLDDRQRQQAQAELSDVTGAVRWADTPEKWQQVQQFYAQHGHDLSAYPFESRERSLMALGKIGEYLKDTPKPDIRATEPGGGLYDVSGGNVRVLVQPNPGTGTMGSPSGGGPQPGQIVGGFRFKGGNPNDRNSWEPAGGQTPQASGGFR